MSYQTIEPGEIVSFSVVRPSVLTAHPSNTARILVSSKDFDPEMIFGGERFRLIGNGVLEISGDGQRFRVDDLPGVKYTDGKTP